jgi:hypothetical protein
MLRAADDNGNDGRAIEAAREVAEDQVCRTLSSCGSSSAHTEEARSSGHAASICTTTVTASRSSPCGTRPHRLIMLYSLSSRTESSDGAEFEDKSCSKLDASGLQVPVVKRICGCASST